MVKAPAFPRCHVPDLGKRLDPGRVTIAVVEIPKRLSHLSSGKSRPRARRACATAAAASTLRRAPPA
ncbi:hypothetical protein G6F19_014293 [Rhizopus arrhizus]|nr:hypothetical protein G6F19_014293 [Rhizopus arrhizus]